MKKLGLILVLAAVGGCRVVGDTGVVGADSETKLLPFEVLDGETKREDLLLRLGAPTSEFEENRLVVYRLLVGRAQKLQPFVCRTDEPVSSDRRLFDLVVVYEKGVVARHALVRIR